MSQLLEAPAADAIRPDSQSNANYTRPKSGATPGRVGVGAAVFAFSPLAFLFSATLLTSSSLLFLVQPMFAKMVLPKLGGTPAVWNTCMVFFQACLLAGYGYAHFLTRRFRLSHQVMIHAAVLALAAVMLPLGLPGHFAAPPSEGNPIGWLLAMLACSVGVPFFVISTTAPLVQRWFALSGHKDGGDPYFLYAASNAGSMAALLAYPAIVEPLLRVGDQARYWTWGYGAFAIAVVSCGVLAWRGVAWHGRLARADLNIQLESEESARAGRPCHIDWLTRLRWIALALVPSSYLLGVTTYITTDVAAVPLLWVLPLAIYLLTFILAFSKRAIVPHRTFVYALPTTALAVVFFLLARAALPVGVNVGLHLLAFFVAAMVCHGELARLRPSARHLTEFYLLMSLGGVLGGAFNALAAPLLFNRALEYPIAIALAALLCPPRALREGTAATEMARRSSPRAAHENMAAAETAWRSSRRAAHENTAAAETARRSSPRAAHENMAAAETAWCSSPRAVGLWINLLCALAIAPLTWIALRLVDQHAGAIKLRMLALALPLLLCVRLAGKRVFALALAGLLMVATFYPNNGAMLLAIHRSFFGVHRIVRSADGRFNELFHGTTIHGRQAIDSAGRPAHEAWPLTYYHPKGPIGRVMSALPAGARANVAVIGLGVGSLAAYAEADQSYTFYEIDPMVRWAAESSGDFTYLADARRRGASVRIVMGDARLTLATDAADHSLDLLVLDAFSGDSVPLHLLTREALSTYLRKLKPTGLLAVHISNLYLDLNPVLANLAADAGCVAWRNDDLELTPAQAWQGKLASQWMLIAPAAQRDAVEAWAKQTGWTTSPPRRDKAVWTDDYSNILSILR